MSGTLFEKAGFLAADTLLRKPFANIHTKFAYIQSNKLKAINYMSFNDRHLNDALRCPIL